MTRKKGQAKRKKGGTKRKDEKKIAKYVRKLLFVVNRSLAVHTILYYKHFRMYEH